MYARPISTFFLYVVLARLLRILRCREVVGEIHLSSIAETYILPPPPKWRDGGVAEPEPFCVD